MRRFDIEGVQHTRRIVNALDYGRNISVLVQGHVHVVVFNINIKDPVVKFAAISVHIE